MSRIRFLLDENISPNLRASLQQQFREMVVWAIGDPGAPKKGTLDPDILLWCEAKGCILVTYNRASMPVHLRDHLAEGRHIPGIFVLRRYLQFGEVVDQLTLIWGASEAEEYRDQLRYLPLAT